MIENPSMCGNGALGCQFADSMRHVPEAAIMQPILTSAKASGHELASTGIIWFSHLRPRRVLSASDGRLITVPTRRIGRPW